MNRLDRKYLRDRERSHVSGMRACGVSAWVAFAAFGAFLGMVVVTPNHTPMDWVWGALIGVALGCFLVTLLWWFDFGDEKVAARARKAGPKRRANWESTVVPQQNAPALPEHGYVFLIPYHTSVSDDKIVFDAKWKRWGEDEWGIYYDHPSDTVPGEQYDIEDPALREAWTDYVFRVDSINRERYEAWKQRQEIKQNAKIALPPANSILK